MYRSPWQETCLVFKAQASNQAWDASTLFQPPPVMGSSGQIGQATCYASSPKSRSRSCQMALQKSGTQLSTTH